MIIGVAGLVLLFFNWYASQVASLSKNAYSAGEARNKRLNNLANLKSTAKLPTIPKAPSAAERRAIAPSTQQIEDVAVGVSAARIVAYQLKDNYSISSDSLVLTLRITNLSKSPCNYKSWSEQSTGVLIHDQFKNYYNRRYIENPPIIEQTIGPEQTIVDIVAFEPPPKTFGYLDLDLPSQALGLHNLPYTFRIPAALVERAETPKPPITVRAPSPPIPPAPTYSDPETDPRVRSRVIGDYKAGAAAIERRANGMGFDRGRKFKLTSYEDLIQEIAANHNLKAEQVRRIIGR
jgi:hypothetical protein